MAKAKLFKSSIPNMFMVLSTGTKAEFINGMFYTTNKKDAAELEAEIERGIAGIWVDPNEPEIDTEAVTPYEQLKKKIREELLAEMAAAGAHSNDRGTYGSSDDNSGVTGSLVTTTQFVDGAKLAAAPKAKVIVNQAAGLSARLAAQSKTPIEEASEAPVVDLAKGAAERATEISTLPATTE